MPERPELEHWEARLRADVVGRKVRALDVHQALVLRVLTGESPGDLLVGQRIVGVVRRGHFMVLQCAPSGLWLAVHPMLAGRFQRCAPTLRRTKDTCFTLTLSDGQQLRYRDNKRMGKAYVLPAEKADQVPGLATIGVDVLGPEFTLAWFTAVARKRRDQVKVFLLDKSVLDSMGNAFADEVLFAAGVHPKARVRDLDDAAVARLHGAIISVLTEARDEVSRRAPPLHEKVRDFLKVRNRKGEPCPNCGAPIRVAGVRGFDAFFCATCQPDGAGRGFAGWRGRGQPA